MVGHNPMDESNPMVRRAVEATEQISRLPDDVVLKILSFMQLKAAMSTSVLSSEWRNILMSLSRLSFTIYDVFGDDPFDIYFRRMSVRDQEAMLRERTSKLVELVNKVLQCHVRTGVEIFRVQFFLHKKHTKHLDKWIKFALESGSKELHLMLSDCLFHWHESTVERYDFPCNLLFGGRSSSLKNLYLQFCCLHPPPNFHGFNSLKVLELDDVHITDRDFHSILAMCSVLEWLRIVLCDELINLQIFSSQLKYLDVALCGKLKSIELSAINLINFEFQGFGGRISFNPVNAPRLLRSSIYFSTSNGYLIRESLIGLLSDLPQLKTLFLFFDVPIENADLSPISHKFTNLKQMVVFIRRKWLEDLLWLVALLNAAPFMERFHLHFDEHVSLDKQEITRQTVNPSKCRHNHLKEVLISGFSSYPNQLELVCHILENANVLELTIDPKTRFYIRGGTWVHATRGEEEVKEIHQKVSEHLLTVPSSAKIVIL